MPKPANLLGQIFGRLTVVESAGSNKFGQRMWVCRCECGKIVVNTTGCLNSRNSVSCGCYHQDRMRGAAYKHGHGGNNNTKTIEYYSWINMITRCRNKNFKSKKHYSGRGIDVCNRWRNSFNDFFDDMGNRPSKAHSLDRINNDLGYYKENCRWATQAEQGRNRRNNLWIEFMGKRMVMADWAKLLNVKAQYDIHRYLKRGKTFEWIYNYYTERNKNK